MHDEYIFKKTDGGYKVHYFKTFPKYKEDENELYWLDLDLSRNLIEEYKKKNYDEIINILPTMSDWTGSLSLYGRRFFFLSRILKNLSEKEISSKWNDDIFSMPNFLYGVEGDYDKIYYDVFRIVILWIAYAFGDTIERPFDESKRLEFGAFKIYWP